MKSKTSAFTLVELVMAMSITAMTALAVAGATMTLSTAYSRSQDYYQNIQTARATMLRFHSAVCKARLIVAADNNTLVLWDGDTNGDGQINIAELLLIDYDKGTRELREYSVVYPDEMCESLKDTHNVHIPLSSVTAVGAAGTVLGTPPYIQERLVATDVTDFTVATDSAPPLAGMVKLQITVGQGTESITLRSASTMRANMTSYVGTVGSNWVLDGEL